MSGSNQAVFFCRINKTNVAAFPPGAGLKVAFYKSSVGGSGSGVGPVARVQALQFMNLAALPPPNGGCSAPVNVPAKPPFPAYVNHTDCPATGAALQNAVPDAGLSDLEPARFRGQFTPQLTIAELNRLTTRSANAVVFGVPVTERLRNALQRVQKSAACVGKETLACMPSLSFIQVRNLFKGTWTNWNQLSEGGGPLPTRPGVTPPSDPRVFVSRRVKTSGTYVANGIKAMTLGLLNLHCLEWQKIARGLRHLYSLQCGHWHR